MFNDLFISKNSQSIGKALERSFDLCPVRAPNALEATVEQVARNLIKGHIPQKKTFQNPMELAANECKKAKEGKPLKEKSAKERALSVYREINALGIAHGLERSELIAICEFIEMELPSKIKNGTCYLKKEETGLARTIEYDKETGHIYIHLKRHDVNELGRGGLKKVTMSIQYPKFNSEGHYIKKPSFVATSTFAVRPGSEREIFFMKEVQGVDGVIELLSASLHLKDKSGKEIFQIVTPLYRGGSLKDYLQDKKPSLGEKMSMAGDVIKALSGMHERGIAHGDIHPGNCLISDKDGSIHLILADLGTASFLKENSFLEQKDLFAAGCMLYDLFHGQARTVENWNHLNEFRDVLIRAKAPGSLMLSSLGNVTVRYEALKNKSPRLSKTEEFELLILSLMHPVVGQEMHAASFLEKILKI